MGLLDTYRFIANHPLTRRNKLPAIERWLRWQLGSRILKHPVVVSFVEESKLLVLPGMTGATGNIYCGLHEFKDMGFVLHFLRPGDLFVDVGANIGSYTILASAVAGADTLSIEPIPSSYKWLLDNIYLNRVERLVDARNIALGSHIGELDMSSDLDTMNHVLLDQDPYKGDSVSVSVETMDEVLQGRKPKLVKIDVEGYESEVLAGAEKMLTSQNLKAVIMEMNGNCKHYGIVEEELNFTMAKFGFHSCSYDPLSRRVLYGDESSGNAGNKLYLRNPDAVQLTVQQSTHYRVLNLEI